MTLYDEYDDYDEYSEYDDYDDYDDYNAYDDYDNNAILSYMDIQIRCVTYPTLALYASMRYIPHSSRVRVEALYTP